MACRQAHRRGKTKVLKSSMFNKMMEFLDDFGTKNIFDDDTLTQLTEQAKSAIGGVSPYGLSITRECRPR